MGLLTVRLVVVLGALTLFASITELSADGDIPYEGRKKCGGCHKSQYVSWKETAHGRAFKSLEPDVKAEAKEKAGLDPDKDYTRDEKCVKCHVVGYQETSGFKDVDSTRNMSGVGCEMCHGAGSKYRIIHRKKGLTFTKNEVIEAGQTYASIDESVCKQCHEHEDTPFQPKVDQRYALNFQEALKDGRSFHGIYPLKGNH